MSSEKFIKKLPVYFQTESNAKFFDATVDQAFQKKSSSRVNAYIGRKSGKTFDLKNDFYKPEISNDRKSYQLEPGVCVIDPATDVKSKLTTYTDIVNYIKNNNGITNNHSRLFTTQKYSFAPPVDVDKLLNFQDYYWVETMPVIEIAGISDALIESSIIGQTQYTTPAGLELSSGMIVRFADSTNYNKRLWVEAVGREIILVPENEVAVNLGNSPIAFLPWDASVESLENEQWDHNVWDATFLSRVEYACIERGAKDGNGWSRNNRWVHKSVVETAILSNGLPRTITYPRATRPIIEFKKDIEIYQFGKKFVGYVDFAVEGLSYAYLSGLSRVNFEEIIGGSVDAGKTLVLTTNNIIYEVSYTPSSTVVLTPSANFRAYKSNGQFETTQYTASELDVIVVRASAYTGSSFVSKSGRWVKSLEDRLTPNQVPLYSLFDINGNILSSYNNSNFAGNEIFSFLIDYSGATPIDEVIELPVVYKNLGQSADIVLESDIEKVIYTYVNSVGAVENITGSYFFKTATSAGDIFENMWMYSDEKLYQNIRYEYIFNNINRFLIDPLPAAVDPATLVVSDSHEMVVQVNGNAAVYSIIKQNNNFYIEINSIIEKSDFISIEYFSTDPLPKDSTGFYVIPRCLSNNPFSENLDEKSLNELSAHFRSIVERQDDADFSNLGESTNYRDTKKDLGKGTVIIQPLGSLVKAMQISSNSLDIIEAINYSKREYQKFKSKLVQVANKIQEKSFEFTSNFGIDSIMSEIFLEINQIRLPSREFSLSGMLSVGDVYNRELIPVLQSINYTINWELTDSLLEHVYVWANDTNSTESDTIKSLYNFESNYKLLTENVDYIRDGSNIEFLPAHMGKEITIRIYNGVPVFVPTTPVKLGILSPTIPKLILDDSYLTPTWVIVGHDGSKTVAYGNYDASGTIINADLRDAVLLNFETRVYNALDSKFKDESYQTLLETNSIVPTESYATDFSLPEVNEILFPDFCSWATKNSVDFITNYTYDENEWKTFNYSGLAVGGSWKSIHSFYFGTTEINTSPWKALNFNDKPDWWDDEYGLPINNKYNDSFVSMWTDIANGVIANGNLAGSYNSLKHNAITNKVPVDANGDLIPIIEYFDTLPVVSTNKNWVFGEMSPAEYAWRISSEYNFDLCKLMFLTQPALFSELFWETNRFTSYNLNREPFYDQVNIQLLDDAGSRSSRVTGMIHNEDRITYKLGYQIWLSDYLLSTNRDITNDLGDTIRNASVNLMHRVGGFTNKDTMRVFLQGSTTVGAETLLIPDANIQVLLRKSEPVFVSTYSGVVIQYISRNQYKVFGYDTNKYFFSVFEPNKSSTPKTISRGGTPATFVNFEINRNYRLGEIVRYNTIFYQCIIAHTATSFSANNWSTLSKLPVSGGSNVNLYQYTSNVTRIPYGTILNSLQAVYEFLIGHGLYLESQHWNLSEFDTETNKIKNWNSAADEFLFWAAGNHEANKVVFLNPIADKVEITVPEGFPDNIERRVNNQYNILNRNGLAVSAEASIISRDAQTISALNANEADGIYFTRVSASQSEHAIVLDNITEFNDIIYDPVLSIRQDRLKVIMTVSGNWYGKLEAPGYFINDDKIVENFENLTDTVRDYFNTETIIDNSDIEAAARGYIGYQDKEYFNSVGIVDEAQFNFYQGFVKEKGTINPIDKALRSTGFKTTAGATINEDWAIKSANFGNLDYSRYDIFLNPNHINSGDQIISVLKKKDRKTYYIDTIDIIRATDTYMSLPEVLIIPAEEDISFTGTQAEAYAILDNTRKLKEIVVTNKGTGYNYPPIVYIDASNDILFANVKFDFISDSKIDEIYYADLDNHEVVSRVYPYSEDLLDIPMTYNNIEMPVAGFVNYNDVDLSFYNFSNLVEIANTFTFVENMITWQGSTYDNNWNVYKLINSGTAIVNKNQVQIITNISCDLLLCKEYNSVLVSVGNLDSMYLAIRINGIYILHTLDGNIVTEDLTGHLVYIFHTVRYETSDVASTIISIFDNSSFVSGFSQSLINSKITEINWINNINRASGYVSSIGSNGSITGVTISSLGKYTTAPAYSITSVNGSGTNLSITINQFGEVSASVLTSGSGYVVGDKITFSKPGTRIWAVIKNSQLYRQQESLINSSELSRSYLYNKRDYSTIAQLSVYDPVKGLLPVVADSNITYKSYVDIVNYSELPEIEIGATWLDLSSFKYTWYEQPISTTESIEDLLIYRKRHWGKVFKGSTPAVYEWTRSEVPPSDYNTENGIPKPEFIQSIEYNPLTSEQTTIYYFWVRSKTSKPNVHYRNLACVEIERIITDGKSSGENMYAAISADTLSDNFVLFGAASLIKNSNAVFSFEIKANNNDIKHSQWELISEGSLIDPALLVKLTDSLTGYTKEVSEYSSVESINTGTGYIQPVPSKMLRYNDRFGLNIRPRQSMFTDPVLARYEFKFTVNRIFTEYPFISEFPNISLLNYNFLNTVDWYKESYSAQNTKADVKVNLLSELDQTELSPGDIILVNNKDYYLFKDNNLELIKVTNGTIALNNRFHESQFYNADIRNFIEYLFDHIFVNDFSRYTAELFFAMIKYAIAEQPSIDWIFKTSYINVNQSGVSVSTNSFLSSSSTNSVADFINEAKPYHSKIRNFIYSIDSGSDNAIYVANDSYLMSNTMRINKVCSSTVITDCLAGYLDSENDYLCAFNNVGSCLTGTVIDAREFLNGWDTREWDLYQWDNESTEDVINVVSAGLFNGNVTDIIDSSTFNNRYVYGVPGEIFNYSITEKLEINVSNNVPAVSCGELVQGSSAMTVSTIHELGSTPGRVELGYNITTGSALINVVYNNAIIASSNSAVTGTGTITFYYDASSSECIVNILPNEQSAWEYILACPVPLLEIQALMYQTTAEVNEKKLVYVPPTPQDVFDNWDRFSANNYFPGGTGATGDAAAWVLLSNPDRVSQPLNTSTYTGFISPESYSSYLLEVVLSGAGGDDDSVGLIIGYNHDGTTSRMLSVTRARGGNTLSGTPGGNNFGFSGVGVSVAGLPSFLVGTNGGWNNERTKVQIQRTGNLITAKCTPFYVDGGPIPDYDESAIISINIADYPQFAPFLNESPYGYMSFSQAGSTFYNIAFTGGLANDNIYDAQAYQTWAYNPDTTSWEDTGIAPQDDLDPPVIVLNPQTGTRFLVTNNIQVI